LTGAVLAQPENSKMSTTNGNGGGPAAQGAEAAPQLNVLAQYVKDLSFENPNAPRSLQQQQAQPQINIQINVNAKPLGGADYEIELKIEGRAEIAGTSPLFLFGFDLLYAGVFRIQNVPQENLHPLIMIECPRLLFPFARELIATAVRNGGFPPLMIDPVDFVSLYRQKLAEQVQPGPATA
jgi:preprotein translocase subunit SecB